MMQSVVGLSYVIIGLVFAILKFGHRINKHEYDPISLAYIAFIAMIWPIDLIMNIAQKLSK